MDFITANFSFILEIIGILTSVIYVILNIKQHISNWFFGLAGYILYVFIFALGHLYASAILSGISCLFMIYGWLLWRRDHNSSDALPVTIYSLKGRLGLLLVCASLSGIVYILLDMFEGAACLWGDSIIAGTSLVGLFVSARKKLETWYIWIGVNTLAVFVYFTTGLYGTTALYGLFLGLSFYGLWEWQTSLRITQEQEASEELQTQLT